MFAPESMATRSAPRSPSRSTYFFMPATARAPAGSATERVSSKMSLMAAQISSPVTSTTSSTASRQTRKGSSPTWRTATPSANRPTESRTTRFPAASARSSSAGGSCGVRERIHRYLRLGPPTTAQR